jgi:hypothetical protein
MIERPLRRGIVAGTAVVLASFSIAIVARGQGATCSLDPVASAAVPGDTLAAVAPFGDGVVAVGTRYSGSNGGALGATIGADGTYDARALDVAGGKATQLDDIAVAGGRAWAVGALADFSPIAVTFDGTTWRAMPIADPGPNEDGLAGVAVVSPKVIWAVGRHQIGQDFVPLIERSDGVAWRIEPSPAAGTSSMLRDVVAVAPDDLWAVGWSVTEEGMRTLVERWNGSAWSIMSAPSPGVDAILTDVAATGPSDVWAVGRTGRGDTTQPLIEHWDGTRWSIVEPPAAPSSVLLSVVATSHGIVIAGRASDGRTEPQPLAWILSGEAWTDLSFTVQGAAWLNAIGPDAGGTLWGVGTAFPENATLDGLVVRGCPGA